MPSIYFVFFFFFCMQVIAYDDSDFACDYYLADDKGFVVNKVVFERRIGWSLHGAWNAVGNDTSPCLSADVFRAKWSKYLAQGKLVHFVDNSPVTHHTCCVTQWHEYIKHGCNKGIPYSVWEFAIFNCIRKFQPTDLYVHRCRFDEQLDCNFVDEVSSEPLMLVNCKEGKKFCSDICYTENGNSICRVNRDQEVGRNYWYSLKFKVPGFVYPQPYKDQPNCYCGMHPDEAQRYHEVEQIDSFGIYEQQYKDRENEYFDHVTSSELERETSSVRPVLKKTTIQPTLNDDIPCTCLPKDGIEKEDEVVEERDWMEFLRVPRVSGALIEIAASRFRVWCRNSKGILTFIRPSNRGNARLSGVEAKSIDEWEEVANRNNEKLKMILKAELQI